MNKHVHHYILWFENNHFIVIKWANLAEKNKYKTIKNIKWANLAGKKIKLSKI